MNTLDLPPVVLIAGPTASGKSALAMALAAMLRPALPATIVNADSMQVYRDLRIVTARPSPDDEEETPHALFGMIDGADACSAARWAIDARTTIAAIHTRGQLPILVGGTGLYIRALLDGIAPMPAIDPGVRASVRAMPVDRAFEALRVEDARAASRLAPGDSARVARALEVVRSTGRPIDEWQRERVGGIAGSIDLHAAVIAPPRDALAQVIDERFERMFDAGRDEVAALVSRRLDPLLPIMRAIGVAQIADHLAGRSDREAALAAGRLATRQYAKRQATWFGRQSPGDWATIAERITANNRAHFACAMRDALLTRTPGVSTAPQQQGSR